MNQETQLGFAAFKQGNLYKNWKRDSPLEAAAVDRVLAGGAPTEVRSQSGKGLMLFAQGKDGFGEYMKGNQGKKYMNDSPVEWSKIQSYRSGGPRPCLGPKPCVTSFTGQGFVHFVAAYKTVPLPDPLWRRDIVYISDLTSFEHTRRAAARAQGFSVLCILADGAVDPNGYRNLNELSLIRNSLLNEGWAITGWASTDDIPELSAARAAQIVRDNGLSGWAANGEAWWEGARAGEGPRWLSTYRSLTTAPVALSCLSSDNPNWARSFVYAPWINNSLSIQPQVYGNVSAAYTVVNGVQTMRNGGVPDSLLNLTFGVYPTGNPIPWADYRTWKGPRGIYLGERLDAADYANLAR